MGEVADKSEKYKRIFTFSNGLIPMSYLGIPVNKIRLKNKDWNKVENKVASKCAGWQGILLNIAGRTTCLTSMRMYMISFYIIPVGV